MHQKTRVPALPRCLAGPRWAGSLQLLSDWACCLRLGAGMAQHHCWALLQAAPLLGLLGSRSGIQST